MGDGIRQGIVGTGFGARGSQDFLDSCGRARHVVGMLNRGGFGHYGSGNRGWLLFERFCGRLKEINAKNFETVWWQIFPTSDEVNKLSMSLLSGSFVNCGVAGVMWKKPRDGGLCFWSRRGASMAAAFVGGSTKSLQSAVFDANLDIELSLQLKR